MGSEKYLKNRISNAYVYMYIINDHFFLFKNFRFVFDPLAILKATSKSSFIRPLTISPWQYKLCLL